MASEAFVREMAVEHAEKMVVRFGSLLGTLANGGTPEQIEVELLRHDAASFLGFLLEHLYGVKVS